MKIVVGVTGASGSIYALRLIDVLKKLGHEVHGVVTDSGWQVLAYECNVSREEIKNRVDVLYDNANIGAAIASGSFKADAMVVLPCSMKTADCITHSCSHNLLTRAAVVMLKQGRPLVLLPL